MALTTKQTLQLLELTKNTQRGIALDELAFITLMRICRDYVDPGRFPMVHDREKWFMKRLDKYRIRFFEKI